MAVVRSFVSGLYDHARKGTDGAVSPQHRKDLTSRYRDGLEKTGGPIR